MGDFHSPLSGDSRGKVVHTCSHARDRGRVELDVADGSNAVTLGCTDLA